HARLRPADDRRRRGAPRVPGRSLSPRLPPARADAQSSHLFGGRRIDGCDRTAGIGGGKALWYGRSRGRLLRWLWGRQGGQRLHRMAEQHRRIDPPGLGHDARDVAADGLGAEMPYRIELTVDEGDAGGIELGQYAIVFGHEIIGAKDATVEGHADDVGEL